MCISVEKPMVADGNRSSRSSFFETPILRLRYSMVGPALTIDAQVLLALVLIAAYLSNCLQEERVSFLNNFWTIRTILQQESLRAVIFVFSMFAFGRKWFGSLLGAQKLAQTGSSALKSVASNGTIVRIRSSMSMSVISDRLLSMNGKSTSHGASLSLSDKTCFAQLKDIEKLSVKDMGSIFRYAIQYNKWTDAQLKAFLSEIRVQALSVVTAIDHALPPLHRASMVLEPNAHSSSPRNFGDMDVLLFSAAVRIFAEWRLLRLTPAGYRNYALGMALTRRDLVQNIGKIEAAVHELLESQTSHNGVNSIRPTIWQLLDYEVQRGVHPKLPYLVEKSGASGILWIMRQLSFQVNSFEYISKVPTAFPSFKIAVRSAYDRVYGDYHGFFLKQIFWNSFKSAPEASVILKFMEETEEIMSRDLSPSNLSEKATVLTRDAVCDNIQSPQERNHFIGMFLEVQQFLKQCHGGHPKVRPPAVDTSLHGPEHIGQKGGDLTAFLLEMHPLISGLDGLIGHFNMKDPSKV
jgi:hypothetical protein